MLEVVTCAEAMPATLSAMAETAMPRPKVFQFIMIFP
jgi:hypothetical protein